MMKKNNLKINLMIDDFAKVICDVDTECRSYPFDDECGYDNDKPLPCESLESCEQAIIKHYGIDL